MNIVEKVPSAEGARKLAKTSCKACHGTGVYGIRFDPQTRKRTTLICECVRLQMLAIRRTIAHAKLMRDQAIIDELECDPRAFDAMAEAHKETEASIEAEYDEHRESRRRVRDE